MTVLTHADFFSGAGAVALAGERAGWCPVSFSEIEPYVSAVLAEHWPALPNLGDITKIGDTVGDWNDAILWTAGFPCQDLSVAGRRAGIGASRSGLVWTFLDLVARHRPPVILLENVPGLLSSNDGRDFGRLISEVAALGYVGSYRVLDAQFFGVPQRRRRVLLLAIDAQFDPDGSLAREVLSVAESCDRHPATGAGKRPQAARIAVAGVADSRPSLSLTGSMAKRHDEDTDTLVVEGATVDTGGVRAADGLAGRLDDRPDLAATLNSGGNNGGFRTEPGEHLVPVLAPTLRVGPATPAAGEPGDTVPIVATDVAAGMDDPLLPQGLDSHRYRACGNGVALPVFQWVLARLATYLTA